MLRGEPDFLDHALAIRAAFLADCDDRGFVQHDPFAAHVDERVGGAKVDREIARKIAFEGLEHEVRARGVAAARQCRRPGVDLELHCSKI
jgi:hypothetical protein